ncbi:hypothetical protein D7X33_50745, partial [Butyricicoccus sp. 1XD8-22]
HELDNFSHVALVYEYDEDMEKDYFVHCSIYHENSNKPFEDALGKYSTIHDMNDFYDIDSDNLTYKVIPFEQLESFIISDMGFIDCDLLNEVKSIIN